MVLAQQTVEGEIEYEDFRLALESAYETVNSVFSDMLGELEEEQEQDESLDTYREGLLDAVSDVATLFQMGLTEMSEWEPSENLGPLRVGHLLLEKAENEYLALLRIIEREALFAEADERSRQKNLWGELREVASKVQEGEAEQELFLRTISKVESSLTIHMEKTITEDFQAAFYLARKFENAESLELAEQKIIFSLLRLKELLGVWPA